MVTSGENKGNYVEVGSIADLNRMDADKAKLCETRVVDSVTVHEEAEGGLCHQITIPWAPWR